MNAVDTNILVYSIDRHEPVKRPKARELLRQLRSTPGGALLLWQVAGEFTRYLRTCEDQGQLTRSATLRYLALFRHHQSTPAEMLAHFLDTRNITQAELARGTGIPRSVLAGRRAISKASAVKLSKYFGVSLRLFVEGA